MKNLTHNAKNPVRIILAAAAACIALGGAAHAGEVQQIHVKYADLNLGTNTGATALYQRIRHAANDVCTVTDNRDLTQEALARTCAAQAMAQAVAAVNNTGLTKVYEAKLGATTAIALAAR
jgi:UrcA family protein